MPKGIPIPVPVGAPKKGEVYRHYKGDQYRIVDLALHSNDDEWMVVYEPMYENPAAPLFTRPLQQWREIIDWQDQKVTRFTKI